MSSERRRAPRYQFIAEAEVTDLESSTKCNAKTGDLSVGGCFLDMLNPLPEGTKIQVRIFQGGATCIAHGRVVFVFPNMGMGVEFTAVEASQAVILQNWISELSRENAHEKDSHKLTL